MSNPMSGLGPGIVTVAIRPKPPLARAGALLKARNTPSRGNLKRSLRFIIPLRYGQSPTTDQMLVLQGEPGQLKCHHRESELCGSADGSCCVRAFQSLPISAQLAIDEELAGLVKPATGEG